jgi:hypothetical protein
MCFILNNTCWFRIVYSSGMVSVFHITLLLFSLFFNDGTVFLLYSCLFPYSFFLQLNWRLLYYLFNPLWLSIIYFTVIEVLFYILSSVFVSRLFLVQPCSFMSFIFSTAELVFLVLTILSVSEVVCSSQIRTLYNWQSDVDFGKLCERLRKRCFAYSQLLRSENELLMSKDWKVKLNFVPSVVNMSSRGTAGRTSELIIGLSRMVWRYTPLHSNLTSYRTGTALFHVIRPAVYVDSLCNCTSFQR